jgi:DNA-binding NarL/FixJ family response regulator
MACPGYDVMRKSAKSKRPVSSGKSIRIVIADDHVAVREGLNAIISQEPDMTVVGEASTGRAAIEVWRKWRPDVVLLDLRMPEMDGLQAIEEIRREDASARIVVLTAFETDNEVARAVKAGAMGYVLKDATREELLDCIRRVSIGKASISPLMAAKLAEDMGRETLSSRELEVLALLARGKSNRQIGAILSIGENTVKSHLRRIFAKLNVLSRTEAIAAATWRGLVRL